jgi:hypothetical protein
MDSELKRIREAAGVSQLTVAAAAKTSMQTVRTFELTNGEGVANPMKRAALANQYAGFRGVASDARRSA